MPILEVATNGQLAGPITLGGPFAPVKGIDGPGGEVVAGIGLGVGEVVGRGAWGTVRHARVGARTDVSETQWGVGEVALGAGRIVLVVIRGRHELGRGAAGRGGRIGVVVGGAIVAASSRAGAGVAVRHAERGPRGRLEVLRVLARRGLMVMLLGGDGGQVGRRVDGHGLRTRRETAGLEDVGDGAGRGGTVTRGGLLELDLGRKVSRRQRLAVRTHARHVEFVVAGGGGRDRPRPSGGGGSGSEVAWKSVSRRWKPSGSAVRPRGRGGL